MYNRGRKFEKKKDFANAYVLYAQAAAADPAKPEYWRRAQALQRQAATMANVMPVFSTSPPAEPIETLEPPAVPEPAELAEARRPEPPVELAASQGTKDFDLRGDNKALWEAVTKAWQFDVVFEGDYEAGQSRQFRMAEAGYRESLHALSSATSSFFVPMSSRLLLVVKDTEAKRREVENTVVLTVPLPEPFTVQEAQELGRTVQQVMEIQRFAIDSSQRLVIFRDRVSKARPAQILFQQLMHSRAQVVLEVELMSTAKTSTIGIGLALPTRFPITPLVQSIAVTGSLPTFALGITGANLLARATRSEARTLYRAELRSLDGMPATMNVGEKYPIVTMNYIGQINPGDSVYTPPPTFNFEDLGLNLKLTPKVHDREEVSLEIEAEFKLLGAGSFNGIPVIANRRFATRARLRFDEAAVISGLVTKNDVRSLSGLAGVVDIPLLGPVLGAALGETNRTNDDIQLLLVIRPRLLTAPPTDITTHPIWVGSESRPRMPL